MGDRIKEILIGMLETDDTGLCEFEKMLKHEPISGRRNDIHHDMDLATYIKQNGVDKTPIIPVITELRSPIVFQTILFLLMESQQM